MPHDEKKKKKRTVYTALRLAETSVVGIPSYPEAHRSLVKQFVEKLAEGNKMENIVLSDEQIAKAEKLLEEGKEIDQLQVIKQELKTELIGALKEALGEVKKEPKTESVVNGSFTIPVEKMPEKSNMEEVMKGFMDFMSTAKTSEIKTAEEPGEHFLNTIKVPSFNPKEENKFFQALGKAYSEIDPEMWTIPADIQRVRASRARTI